LSLLKILSHGPTPRSRLKFPRLLNVAVTGPPDLPVLFGSLPIGVGSLFGLRRDDTAVIPRLYEVFSQCIGQSIHKIGDLEFDM
jgi:hypothetical protein